MPAFPEPMMNVTRRPYKYSAVSHAAHRATDWIGSVQSLAVHTALFLVSFALVFFGFNFEQILLVVTTIVSLEAIYLAIFIQMAINQNSQSLVEVEEDIDVIQEKVVELHEDVDQIQKEDMKDDTLDRQTLDKLEATLSDLIVQIEKMKNDR